MSAMQPTLSNGLANQIFRNSAMSVPAHLALALFVGAIEVAGSGYARIDMKGSSLWTVPSNGLITNVSAIAFNAATAPWGTVDHYGFFDALTGGNLLIYDLLSASRVIGLNDVMNFAIGQFGVSLQ